MVGLATDYCVGSTALDAQEIGIPATVLTDAARYVQERIRIRCSKEGSDPDQNQV